MSREMTHETKFFLFLSRPGQNPTQSYRLSFQFMKTTHGMLAFLSSGSAGFQCDTFCFTNNLRGGVFNTVFWMRLYFPNVLKKDFLAKSWADKTVYQSSLGLFNRLPWSYLNACHHSEICKSASSGPEGKRWRDVLWRWFGGYFSYPPGNPGTTSLPISGNTTCPF